MMVSELDNIISLESKNKIINNLREKINIFSKFNITCDDIKSKEKLNMYSRLRTKVFQTLSCDEDFAYLDNDAAISVLENEEMYCFSDLDFNEGKKRELLAQCIILSYVMDCIKNEQPNITCDNLTMLGFQFNDNPTDFERKIFDCAVDLLIPNDVVKLDKDQQRIIFGLSMGEINELREYYKAKIINDYDVSEIAADYKISHINFRNDIAYDVKDINKINLFKYGSSNIETEKNKLLIK